jgi:hypothetical protein
MPTDNSPAPEAPSRAPDSAAATGPSPRGKIIMAAAGGLLVAAVIFLFVQYRTTSASLEAETQLRRSAELRVKTQEDTLAQQIGQINRLENQLQDTETKNTEFQSRVGALEKDQAILQSRLESAEDSRKKSEERLAEEQTTVTELQKRTGEDRVNQARLLSHIERLMGEKASLQEKLAALETGKAAGGAVALPEVVVSDGERPRRAFEGAILAVNKRYDFVVFNLGEKDGVKAGSRWDVVEEGKNMGEVVARRVLPAMTVADVDPRQTRSALRKNATVVPHE